jgi:predicted kinase
MQLVIISGPEATGKSAIGHELAQQTGYQYESKDVIKEALFDKAPRSTWDFSWYENEAKQRLFRKLDKLIAGGTDTIVESNFMGKDKARLKACLMPDVSVTEIYCAARGLTSFRRFVRRNESGRRHKGHHDRRWYPTVFFENCLRAVGVQWPYGPVGVTQKLLKVDSTDFSKVDFQAITRFVQTK